MRNKHLSLEVEAAIPGLHSRLKASICLMLIFPLLLLTSCAKKETWFSCIEGYTKNRGDQTADFYIKILRTNGSIEANYIDAHNSVRASTTETPSTFTVSATLYPTVFKKRLVQTFFFINKKNLKYSKQMSHFDPTQVGKPLEFTGGISIQNAGICRKLNAKPKSLIS